jgi:hypothetical protein
LVVIDVEMEGMMVERMDGGWCREGEIGGFFYFFVGIGFSRDA